MTAPDDRALQNVTIDAIVAEAVRVARDGPQRGEVYRGLRCGVNGLAFAVAGIASARRSRELEQTVDALHDRLERVYDSLSYPDDELIYASSFAHSDASYWLIRADWAVHRGDSAALARAFESFEHAQAMRGAGRDFVMGVPGWLAGAVHMAQLLRLGDAADPPRAACADLAGRLFADVVADLPAAASDAPELDDTFAHGWGGALFACLEYGRFFGVPPPARVAAHVERLAATAEERVPPLLHISPECTYPGSWCNGSAGQTFFWLSAHRVFGTEALLDLARYAAHHSGQTWKGIGPSMCCGLTGQSYALFAVEAATGDGIWEKRAVELANLGAQRVRPIRGMYDRALFVGMAGPAVLFAQLQSEERPHMPLLDSFTAPRARPAPAP